MRAYGMEIFLVRYHLADKTNNFDNNDKPKI